MLNDLLASKSRPELWEAMRLFKEMHGGDRNAAKAWFAERPALTKAVFQAQVLLGEFSWLVVLVLAVDSHHGDTTSAWVCGCVFAGCPGVACLCSSEPGIRAVLVVMCGGKWAGAKAEQSTAVVRLVGVSAFVQQNMGGAGGWCGSSSCNTWLGGMSTVQALGLMSAAVQETLSLSDTHNTTHACAAASTPP